MPGSGPLPNQFVTGKLIGPGMVPGSGMLAGTGTLPGQPPTPVPPQKNNDGNGLKIFGIASLVIAILGLITVITLYILFGWPKDNYKEAASDNLVVPSVTTTTSDTDDTEEEESEEAPEEEEAEEESDTEE